MNRYVINVDVGKKASDTELNVLRNMIRKWADRLLLDPGAIVVYPYVRKEKIFSDKEKLDILTKAGKMGSEVNERSYQRSTGKVTK